MGATAISIGGNYACALVNGGVQCWGTNGFGASKTPEPVMGLSSNVTSVSVGYNSACAVVGGTVECWGDNTYGELGNNTTTASSVPTPAPVLSSGFTAVSVSFEYGCALKSSGAVWCWNERSTSRPRRLAGSHVRERVAHGTSHTLRRDLVRGLSLVEN